MKFYSIGWLDITDRAWVDAYAANVTPMVERYGGRYLSRSARSEVQEGTRRPKILVLVEWPSREAADAFYESAEYRPYRDSRIAGSQSEFLIVPGEDVAGLAKIG